MVFFSSGSQCWLFSHEPSSLFHHSVLVGFYDDALTELGKHYANRLLIDSCPKELHLNLGRRFARSG